MCTDQADLSGAVAKHSNDAAGTVANSAGPHGQGRENDAAASVTSGDPLSSGHMAGPAPHPTNDDATIAAHPKFVNFLLFSTTLFCLRTVAHPNFPHFCDLSRTATCLITL